jgi:hypothetical protein
MRMQLRTMRLACKQPHTNRPRNLKQARYCNAYHLRAKSWANVKVTARVLD